MPYDLIGRVIAECTKILHLYPALPVEVLDVVRLTGRFWQLLVMLLEDLVEALLTSTSSALSCQLSAGDKACVLQNSPGS